MAKSVLIWPNLEHIRWIRQTRVVLNPTGTLFYITQIAKQVEDRTRDEAQCTLANWQRDEADGSEPHALLLPTAYIE